MLVKELQNCAHVFTLKDKTTFRIFALETREVSTQLVSEEMYEAQRRGSIALLSDATKTNSSKSKSKKEVLKNG